MSKVNNAFQEPINKFLVSPEPYFNLFDKYIPRYDNDGEGKDIMSCGFANPGVLHFIMKVNPKANYTIVEVETNLLNTITLLYGKTYNIKIVDINTDEDYLGIFKTMTKFDCIIMNPPYNKNLHLKILAKAIEHLKDDNSTCVNLSPMRWLQDPLAKYKKNSDYHRFEEPVSKHIKNLEVISAKSANVLFGINNFTDLAIYDTAQIGGYSYDVLNRSNFKDCDSIFKKVMRYVVKTEIHTLKYHLTTDCNDYRVVITLITGQRGQQNLKNFYVCATRPEVFKDGVDVKTKKQYIDICGGIKKAKAKQHEKKVEFGLTVNFKSSEEANNFIATCRIEFMTFWGIMTKNDMHPQFKFIPFMGDAINPRTGLRGYLSTWTDEDFYQYFNITKAEQKIIEDTLAKYE